MAPLPHAVPFDSGTYFLLYVPLRVVPDGPKRFLEKKGDFQPEFRNVFLKSLRRAERRSNLTTKEIAALSLAMTSGIKLPKQLC